MPESLTVQLRRLLDASPERIWEAWTQPDLMVQWFSPMGMITSAAEADVQVGGRYRIHMARSPQGPPPPPQFGDVLVAEGVYQQVDHPRLLTFTWSWAGWGERSLVRIELSRRGRQTELLLTHSRLADEESRAFHEKGWRSTLDKLRLSITGAPKKA